MRRDRRYYAAKILQLLPQLSSNIWHLMRFVALWHRRQLLRVTGMFALVLKTAIIPDIFFTEQGCTIIMRN